MFLKGILICYDFRFSIFRLLFFENFFKTNFWIVSLNFWLVKEIHSPVLKTLFRILENFSLPFTISRKT